MNQNKTLGFLVSSLLLMLIWKPHIISRLTDTSVSYYENKRTFLLVVHNSKVT